MKFMMFVLSFMICAVMAISCKAHASCFPQNTLNLMDEPMDAKSGISEAVFNAQLDLVEKVWEGQANQMGFHIKFNRLWKDGTVNSDTYEDGKDWIINSYGGLARYPNMTADAYLAVACHELGHHMGGAPLFQDQSWPASVEGAADYFATLRCMKEIGVSDSRIAAASQVLANTLAKLGGEKLPRPSTPDRTIVKVTYEAHPKAQCRLDTYLKGLECPDQGTLSRTDAKVNSCHDYTSGFGVRPRCWYAP